MRSKLIFTKFFGRTALEMAPHGSFWAFVTQTIQAFWLGLAWLGLAWLGFKKFKLSKWLTPVILAFQEA
jgi:hypothetical protein